MTEKQQSSGGRATTDSVSQSGINEPASVSGTACAAAAIDCIALRGELRDLFQRLCLLSAAGNRALGAALNASSAEECGDLIIAAETTLCAVGFIGELGVRACGDPGLVNDPMEWLRLDGGIRALNKLEALGFGGKA